MATNGQEDIDNKIIYVSFRGQRGVQAPSAPETPETVAATSAPKPKADKAQPDDAMSAFYSRREVCRLFGYSEARLRYWDRTRFIEPSGNFAGRRYYTFQDLISLKAAKGLIDDGIPMRRVRRTVEALRASLPRLCRPLSQMRIVSDGNEVVVRAPEGSFEALTGQGVLDFHVDSFREEVVRVLRPQQPQPAVQRAAYTHYLDGCRLDENEETLAQAAQAYLEALRLDPTMANAMTNLGNVRYRMGDIAEAKRWYHQALRLDAGQSEAWYNLGYLHFELGELQSALESFQRAVQADPGFANAHFNLAMTLEELSRKREASTHWNIYIELEPCGEWTDIARHHLAELGR